MVSSVCVGAIPLVKLTLKVTLTQSQTGHPHKRNTRSNDVGIFFSCVILGVCLLYHLKTITLYTLLCKCGSK